MIQTYLKVTLYVFIHFLLTNQWPRTVLFNLFSSHTAVTNRTNTFTIRHWKYCYHTVCTLLAWLYKCFINTRFYSRHYYNQNRNVNKKICYKDLRMPRHSAPCGWKALAYRNSEATQNTSHDRQSSGPDSNIGLSVPRTKHEARVLNSTVTE